jgi:hypothetical protein
LKPLGYATSQIGGNHLGRVGSGFPSLWGASQCSGGYRPAARRAASSICAVPKTRTIAAIVAVSFAGSVTVGCGGHLISIASGASGRWTSSTTSRSDLVTAPTARNRSESLDAELPASPELATSPVFHRCERFVLRCRQNHKISRNCAWPRRQLPGLAGGSIPSSSSGLSRISHPCRRSRRGSSSDIGRTRSIDVSCSVPLTSTPRFGSMRSPQFSHGRAEHGGQRSGGRNDGLPGPRRACCLHKGVRHRGIPPAGPAPGTLVCVRPIGSNR